MNRSDCYAVTQVRPGAAVPEEFQAAALLAWSDRLVGFATCPAVVGFLLKLDAMSKVPMPGGHRVLLLRVLEDPLHRVLRRMPRLSDPTLGRLTRKGWDLNMDQRLVCMVCRNIKLAHAELDLVHGDPDQCEARLWLVEQEFRLLERQVLSAVMIGQEPPPGTWLEVHACYQHVTHGLGRGGRSEPGDACGDEVDLSSIYRRLLLIGIVADAVGERVVSEGVVARIRALTPRSQLGGPEQDDQGAGLWVIDTRIDVPARRFGPQVEAGAGHILSPAAGFAELI